MKAKNCSKEEVEKKYLMTIDEFLEKMEDKPPYSEEYKIFFNKEIKNHLWGVLKDTCDDNFCESGGIALTLMDKWKCLYMWLDANHYVRFDEDTRRISKIDDDLDWGFSGLLLNN